MGKGKRLREQRRTTEQEGPQRPEARRVLPPSMARELRHEQRRGLRRGLAYWSSLTPRQRRDIQTEAEKQAEEIDTTEEKQK